MNIIVDTSVIISVITNEKHKKEIIRKTKGYDLLAPLSLHWEIANAFSAMFKRNRITLEQSKIAISYYTQIPLRLVKIELNNALELAFKNKIYAYDAYFLVCAKQYNSKLISLDKGLLRIAKENNIEVVEV
jgi:predicted nucleic acid-binding protein